MLARMLRAALFALVGVLSFAYWMAADPSYEVSDSHSGWMWVLPFSAAILLPTLMLPVFAQFVGGRRCGCRSS
jgi:hypothetical protein